MLSKNFIQTISIQVKKEVEVILDCKKGMIKVYAVHNFEVEVGVFLE